jgi:hypothetical protein
MGTDEYKLGYDVEGYEYHMANGVVDTKGSKFNKEHKIVFYLLKSKGYTDETDWTEGWKKTSNDMEQPSEFRQQNPQAANDTRLYVGLELVLLGDIVVPGRFTGKQLTAPLRYDLSSKLPVYQYQKKKHSIADNQEGQEGSFTPVELVTVSVA